ncbi:ExbD/TolR family protein [Roseibium litorale]|uniref:Biopolymer transporter ExbD n=1 Tax=Roseibium litorale TaxID=2803841 RepID=A0ABR9CG72_9HYPH|nr:biopolymer transporter ExbD [Roseibium litorale]MBD8889924.1 biopolymer transporter ExbD [Roseibium litorale]
MKKLPLAPIQRQSENTLSLINIVFLMLIFFLVAGQLAPPLDKSVTMIDSEDAPPVPPPHALVVHADGSLHYMGEPITVEEFLIRRPETTAAAASASAADGTGAPDEALRIIADKDTQAVTLLDVVSDLQKAGAGRMTIVTARSK